MNKARIAARLREAAVCTDFVSVAISCWDHFQQVRNCDLIFWFQLRERQIEEYFPRYALSSGCAFHALGDVMTHVRV